MCLSCYFQATFLLLDKNRHEIVSVRTSVAGGGGEGGGGGGGEGRKQGGEKAGVGRGSLLPDAFLEEVRFSAETGESIYRSDQLRGFALQVSLITAARISAVAMC